MVNLTVNAIRLGVVYGQTLTPKAVPTPSEQMQTFLGKDVLAKNHRKIAYKLF